MVLYCCHYDCCYETVRLTDLLYVGASCETQGGDHVDKREREMGDDEGEIEKPQNPAELVGV